MTCRVLCFTKQAFYKWRANPVSQRDWDDAHLINAALDSHADDPAFGYRFIADELREQGILAGENRVARLCSQQRIRSVFAKKPGLNRKAGPPVKPRHPRRTNERNRHERTTSPAHAASSARGGPRSARSGRSCWRPHPCGLQPIGRKLRQRPAVRGTSPSPSTASAPAGSRTALAVRQTSLGTILTDGRGFTLYAFDADKGTMSNCSGACATAWPPDTATGTDPQVGTGATQSLVGQTTRADGTTQLTYAGRPLYLFTGDSAPGSTNGDGSTAFGARWDAVTATGQDATGG